MSIQELKTWIQAQLETIDPRDSDPSESYAAIVRELKIRTLDVDPALSLSLPIEDKKWACSAVGQLRRILEKIEAPPPAVDGGALSVAQAGRLLGVSRGMVYKLCGEGQLGHRKAGRRILITRQQIESYQGTQTAPATAGEFRHLRR